MRPVALVVGVVLLVAAAPWTVGGEREIEPGVYAKLFSAQDGWRVWRFETRRGGHCAAVKAAGGAPLTPIGPHNFAGPKPHIQIVKSIGYPERQWSVAGRWGSLRGEYRLPGERFYTPIDDDPRISTLDGRAVDLHIASWEYPSLRAGLADERGAVSLTGLNAALAKLEACASPQ